MPAVWTNAPDRSCSVDRNERSAVSAPSTGRPGQIAQHAPSVGRRMMGSIDPCRHQIRVMVPERCAPASLWIRIAVALATSTSTT